MAFTTTEKNRIVRLLGWPSKVIVQTSTVYNSVVNDRLSVETEAEAEVRTILDRILTLDERLESAICRVSTTEVDGVKLNREEIPMLRRERRRLIEELSEFLSIPNRSRIGSMMGRVSV